MIGFLSTKVGRTLFLILSIIIGLVLALRYFERVGRDKQSLDTMKTQSKLEGKAREAVAKERSGTADADIESLVKRLRSRDDDWGGL